MSGRKRRPNRKDRPRTATTPREGLAARDGTTVHVQACCDLEVTIGYPRLTVRHDDDCPALHPDTPAGMTARMRANAAVAALLDRMQLGPTVVIVGAPTGGAA